MNNNDNHNGEAPSRKILIVGANRLGLELGKGLGGEHCVLMDSQPEALSRADQEGLTIRHGEATSRLVLERLHLKEFATLIAATYDDTYNLETCRAAQQVAPEIRMMAVQNDPEATARFTELGIETVSVVNNVVGAFKSRIFTSSTKPVGLGMTAGEIVEVTVHPLSRLCYVPIAQLAARNWRIGMIYRDREIVFPRPWLSLQPHDRVVLTGMPKMVEIITGLLTTGKPQFPMQFGPAVLLPLMLGEERDRPLVVEAITMARHTGIQEIDVLIGRPYEKIEIPPLVAQIEEALPGVQINLIATRLGLIPALLEHVQRKDYGVVVVPPFPRSTLDLSLKRGSPIVDLLHQGGCPILLATGQSDYRTALLPVTGALSTRRTLDLVLDMTSQVGLALTALSVSPPNLVLGQTERLAMRTAQNLLVESARIHNLEITFKRDKSGNPIRQVLATARNHDLLVLPLDAQNPMTLSRRILRPDVSYFLAHQSPISTLILPAIPDSPEGS